MLNKVFLEGIVAQKPILKKAINGESYITLIVICKVEQQRLREDNIPVMLYPDDIIPIMVFGKKAEWCANNRVPGDVVSIEGKLKTPNRKVVIQAEHVKLIKSAEFKKYEREVITEAERRKFLNEQSNS